MVRRVAFIQLGAMRTQWFAELSRKLLPAFEAVFYSLETNGRSVLSSTSIQPFPYRLPWQTALLGYMLGGSCWESAPPDGAWRGAVLEAQVSHPT